MKDDPSGMQASPGGTHSTEIQKSTSTPGSSDAGNRDEGRRKSGNRSGVTGEKNDGTSDVNLEFAKGDNRVMPYGAISNNFKPNSLQDVAAGSSSGIPFANQKHISTIYVPPKSNHQAKSSMLDHETTDKPQTGHVNQAFSTDGERPSSAVSSNATTQTDHLVSLQQADSQLFLPKATENCERNGKAYIAPKDGAVATGVGGKDGDVGDDDDDDDDDDNPRVYFQRWFMLFAFCMYSFSNAYQWINLNIIGNLIEHYYNESLPADSYETKTNIDMLSMIYMIAYIPLIFPATWLLDRKGLRLSCILGSFLNAVGAGLKCFSVSPDRFPLLMVAQTICGIAQIWVLGIPPRLAAVWFGPDQVSTATSIGVFGNQVGIAVGFLIPPLLVKEGGVESMTAEFNLMHYITAGCTVAIFLLILICVNTGSFYAISTLLNTVILHYHEGEEVKAGQIGLTLVLTGVVGAVMGGIWLDRTKTFKSTTIAIYLLTLAGMVAFTFTLELDHIWIVYVTGGSLGFFMTGYLPVGFEFAAEITYPESEGTSSGLLNMSAQIFGVAFTLGMRAMMENMSVMGANVTLCVFLLGGTILTALIKPDYRRQEAGKKVLKEIVSIEESFPAKN